MTRCNAGALCFGFYFDAARDIFHCVGRIPPAMRASISYSTTTKYTKIRIEWKLNFKLHMENSGLQITQY